MRSTGSQPAQLYGLAKLHKKDIPLRHVLSLPRSSSQNVNKKIGRIFDKIEGANIERDMQEAREIIEKVKLDSDGNTILLNVKSLYTDVPLNDAIGIALRKLYEQEKPPEIAFNDVQRLLNLAVGQVHFNCNDMWYTQKDGLAKTPFMQSYWQISGLKSSNMY